MAPHFSISNNLFINYRLSLNKLKSLQVAKDENLVDDGGECVFEGFAEGGDDGWENYGCGEGVGKVEWLTGGFDTWTKQVSRAMFLPSYFVGCIWEKSFPFQITF